jgi:signal peptidase II
LTIRATFRLLFAQIRLGNQDDPLYRDAFQANETPKCNSLLTMDGRTTSSVATSRNRLPIDRITAFLVMMVTGGAIDLWSKSAIFEWRGMPGQKDTWWLVDGHFGIETAINLGAVFGVGQGKGLLFAALSVVAAIGIFVWLFRFGAIYSWWLTVALGCVSGGIVGNLYDRLGMWWEPRFLEMGYPIEYKSGVRDWVLWQVNDNWKWPNFNIADSLLVVGACMLMYQSLFPGDQEPSKQVPSNDSSDDTPIADTP